MLQQMLQLDPNLRPKVDQLIKHPFFTKIKCDDFFTLTNGGSPISDSEIVGGESDDDEMEDIPQEYESVKNMPKEQDENIS
jgi:serine/threonine protein kinase